MIKNIQFKPSYLALFLVLILISCQGNKNNEPKEYFYEIFGENNKIRGFIKRSVFNYKDFRIDSIYRYSKNKKLINVNFDSIITKKGFVKSILGEDYLFETSKDTCYFYINNVREKYKICNKKDTTLIINQRTYENINEYSISHIITDGITKRKYFDEDFILLKEEFVHGYAPYFRIERSEKIEGLNN
jgi:hypothetical protein